MDVTLRERRRIVERKKEKKADSSFSNSLWKSPERRLDSPLKKSMSLSKWKDSFVAVEWLNSPWKEGISNAVLWERYFKAFKLIFLDTADWLRRVNAHFQHLPYILVYVMNTWIDFCWWIDW